MEGNFFTRNKGLVIVIAIIALLAIWLVGRYNSFVRQNVAIDGQWAQVENQFQRRFDLIPNIVNTVKGVAAQEQEVFGAIAEARTRYSGATTPNERAAAASQVESALGRLLVIAENYPVLQSSQAYRDLIVSLEGTENRIAVERMKYNEEVGKLNTSIKTFPSSIAAAIFGVDARAFYDIAEGVEAAPTVDFGV